MGRPARPWFRFYVEAVHDRKLRRLKPEHRWLFVACLAAARQSPVPGVLLVGDNDPMTLEDLVDFAAMPSAQVRAGMAALCEAGVIELDDDDVWTVPAWADRQYESDNSAERVRKHRYKEQSCNAETPLHVTPPETETETDTETEQKTIVELALNVVPASSPVDDVFEFWKAECNHPRSLLDNKRKRRIEWALRHYPPEDIADAIRGAATSEFHQGQNANGRVYDDLALILRDAEHLERFRDEYRNGRRKPIPKAWGALERMAKEGRIA